MSHYRHGHWYVQCDRCGRKRWNDAVTKEWTGVIVCADTCLDTRNPQDFVRARNDPQPVPYIRSSPTVDSNWPNFADVTYNTSAGTQETTIPDGHFNNGL